MAFTLIEGFDLYNGVSAPLGILGRWQNISSGGSITVVAGRFAGQGVQFTDGSGNHAAMRRVLATSQSDLSVGLAYRHMNHSNIGNQPFAIFLDSAGGSQLSLYMAGATGQIHVYRGTGAALLFSTPVGTLIEANWQHIELVGNISNSGGLEIFVDGISRGTFSGDTQQTANSNIQQIELHAPDGSGGGNAAQFDDIFINNVGTQIGEMRIDAMRVNSDSTEQDWNPTPASAAYQALDDTTVNTADYIQADTVGDTSFFGVVDLSVTPESIRAVQLSSFALKTDAATRQFKMKARVGSDVDDGPDHTLTATYQMFNAIFETAPDGSDWDATSINNLEIGVEVVT